MIAVGCGGGCLFGVGNHPHLKEKFDLEKWSFQLFNLLQDHVSPRPMSFWYSAKLVADLDILSTEYSHILKLSTS